MLFLRAALLWALVSINIVGAAVLFRRLFPRESPWFGFFVLPLAFVFVFNCIEHFVAVPQLVWLLPITTFGFVWLMVVRKDYSWEGLGVPIAVFLLAFAFSFGIKCLRPDIGTNSEGMEDLKRVLDFSMGETLPPTDGWMPPYHFVWYYNLHHYAASIVKRLFALDVGTAYNISLPLLTSLIALAGAGAAYSVSDKRPWIAFLTLFLFMATFTGGSALADALSLNSPNVWVGVIPNLEWDNHNNNPLWWFVTPERAPSHLDLKLFPPGCWNWMDEFHSNLLGHFLMVTCVLAASELFRENRSNWPWIWLLILPVLTVISSTWVLFMIAFLCVGSLIIAWVAGRRPENYQFVVIIAVAFLALLWPTIFNFTGAPSDKTPLHLTPPEWRTPFWTFVLQWWPVYIPWFVLCFFWHKLRLELRWFHLAFLAMSLFVEFFSIANQRMLTTEKMWGPLYTFGLVTLLPLMFVLRGWLFRPFQMLIVLCASISLYGWLQNTWICMDFADDSFHLEGNAYMINRPVDRRMLQVLDQVHNQTILSGFCGWEYDYPPAFAVFSQNRCYVAWYTEDVLFGLGGESEYRMNLNNDFYAGKLPDPLGFLLDNQIAAVIISPDRVMPDDILDKLKKQLAPAYLYIDCRIDPGSNTIVPGNNGGIFMRRDSYHHPLLAGPEMPKPVDNSSSTNAPPH
jgi:hypothetical protein